MPKSPDAFRTISEVAEWLGIQAHVLRFWESKFTQVKPIKRAGGRRYYRPADMLLLGGIRKLLHEDGLTIKGVQKILREEGMSHVAAMSGPLDDEDDLGVQATVTPTPAPEPEEAVVLPFEAPKDASSNEPEATPEEAEPVAAAPEVAESEDTPTEAEPVAAAPEEPEPEAQPEEAEHVAAQHDGPANEAMPADETDDAEAGSATPADAPHATSAEEEALSLDAEPAQPDPVSPVSQDAPAAQTEREEPAPVESASTQTARAEQEIGDSETVSQPEANAPETVPEEITTAEEADEAREVPAAADSLQMPQSDPAPLPDAPADESPMPPTEDTADAEDAAEIVETNEIPTPQVAAKATEQDPSDPAPAAKTQEQEDAPAKEAMTPLPSFLRKPAEVKPAITATEEPVPSDPASSEATADAPPAQETPPEPERPKARDIGMPEVTPEAEIHAQSAVLTRATQISRMDAATAAQAKPLLEQLSALRDRMAARAGASQPNS